MAFEKRDMSGALFANDKRGDNEKAPNAKGDALIDGVEYWVSAWTKVTKEGKKWQSLAFTRKDKAKNPAPAPAKAETPDDPTIPF